MKLINYIVLFAIGLFAASCGSKEFNLSSATKNLSFAEEGATENVVINGSDGNCEVEYCPEWVEAAVADSVVSLKVKPNTLGEKREDVLVVKCGKSNISIPISQYSKATKLELPNGNKLKFSKEGGDQNLVVVSDGLVKVESFEPVIAEMVNGILKVSTPQNEGKLKKGIIKLTAGDILKEVEVIIDGKVCTLCKGSGWITCKSCGGIGLHPDGVRSGYGCKACGGKGYGNISYNEPGFKVGKGKVKCTTCKGSGV